MSDEQTTTQAKSASTASFITALATAGALFAIEIAAFTVLRPRFRVIYEPRAFIGPTRKRVASLTSSLFAWPIAIYKADYEDIKRTNGLDAYFFVHFLRMMVKIFLPIWIISWAVLMPIDAAGSTAGLHGLDMFTFGNVSKSQQARYAAHLVLVFGFTAWILWNIKKEMHHFITTRHRHLVDPIHSGSAQANTILVTGVPRKYLDEEILTTLFNHLPGGVKKVWLNRDFKKLPDVYQRRLEACSKLESAETNLFKIAAKIHRKSVAKDTKTAQGKAPTPTADVELNGQSVLDLVPRNKRPTHRLPLGFMPFSLPLIGKKVDSIDWAKEQIATTNKLLDEGRAKFNQDIVREGTGEDEHFPPLNSAFILFNQQIAAHLAAQALIHNDPYRMANKYTEVAPADVIWSNLGLNPYEARVRMAISYLATAGLIILWAFPVAFVGIISNIYSLCATYSWLHWLCTLPAPVVGIISGDLPPLMLIILMMLLPIILRLLAHFEGIPRRTGLELSLMTRFFIFQVIHSFLIVTVSSGIIKALPGIVNNPTSVPNLLAENLPGASTFFLTYVILQGIAGSAAGVLQIVPLIIYYIKLIILGSTPRSIYGIKNNLRDVAWGTLFPSMTLITVITLGYSIISPVINGLSCVAFFLFYQTWKYLFLWQLDQPASGDTGGLFFPKAMTHIFVGLYVQQICLCALFFLARDNNDHASAIPEGALMVVLIIITAGYHMIINDSYGPLIKALPLTLAHRSYGMPKEGDGTDSIIEDESEAAQRDFGPVEGSENGDAPLKPRPQVPPSGGKAISGVQAVKGPEPTAEYGDSVPVEGKSNDGPTDFNNPCLEPQRIIWIPRDSLGLAEIEERDIKAQGIEVSTEHAEMDVKGKIDVTGLPPGMDDD